MPQDYWDDEARPLPQRAGAGPDPDAAHDDAPDDASDDVYVVDVRGRQGPRTRRSGPTPAAGAAAAGGTAAGAAESEADYEHTPTRAMPQVRGPSSARSEQPRPSRGSSGSTPNQTPPPAPPRRRRRRPVRTAVFSVFGVLVLLLAYLVGVPLHAWNSVSRIETAPTGERPEPGAGHNYLLIGSDSREGLTKAQKKELTTGSFEGKRTDSIILIHSSSSGGKPVLLSFPRDSYVPIPGNGSNKINAAYVFGGPQLLTQTVEQNTGLRIDGYLEIGFGGFATVVDSLGGVDICVKMDMDDPKAGINLSKGCQVLDGKNALGYVRARYSDPRGDVGRAERQRQFLGAVMKGAVTPGTVLNPKRYWDFTHAAAGGVIVGEDTGLTDVSRVGLAMRAASSDGALSLVVPIENLNFQTNAGSSVKWDTERAQALFTILREDQPLTSPPAGTDGKPSGG